MFDWLADFVQWVWDWLASGIYDFVKAAFVLLTKMMIVGWYKFTLFSVDVAYTVFTEFIDSLNLSQYLQEKYNSLDSASLKVLSFFRVPEGLTLIFNAIGTKIVMRFVPFARFN